MQPDIAALGDLIGDSSRAKMLIALMGGKALTATELALEADISAQTASRHLAQLVNGGFLTVRKQGRHKYFQLTNPQVADLLESLLTLSAQLAMPTITTGPTDQELRFARVCYDHLAGEMGVQLYNALVNQGLVLNQGGMSQLTDCGRLFFRDQGFELERIARQRRPVCKACLDWSERTDHMAGSLGQWILQDLFDNNLIKRQPDSRALRFTDTGLKRFKARYGL